MVRELDAAPDWLTVTTQTFRDTEYLRRVAALHLGAAPGARPWTFRNYYGHRRHDSRGRRGLAFAERDLGNMGILQTWGSMTAVVGRQLAEHRVQGDSS